MAVVLATLLSVENLRERLEDEARHAQNCVCGRNLGKLAESLGDICGEITRPQGINFHLHLFLTC